MKRLLCIVAIVATACCQKTERNEGFRTTELDDSAWEVSQWISAADAPVVSGKVKSNENHLAADGASWFLADVKNEKRLKKAVC